VCAYVKNMGLYIYIYVVFLICFVAPCVLGTLWFCRSVSDARRAEEAAECNEVNACFFCWWWWWLPSPPVCVCVCVCRGEAELFRSSRLHM
jgi:hypothetical protein